MLIKDNTEGSEVVVDFEWKSRITQEINEIIEFEKRLANITIPPDQKRGEEMGVSNRKTLEELNIQLDFFNWTAYFENAFSRINYTISNETEVVLYGSDFMQGLSDLVWEYANSTRGRKTLDSYMKWHVIKFVRSALSKPYRDAGKILEKALLGNYLDDYDVRRF